MGNAKEGYFFCVTGSSSLIYLVHLGMVGIACGVALSRVK